MEKIRYRYVYDRKHALNRSGEALVLGPGTLDGGGAP